jgi:hypothetical protein
MTIVVGCVWIVCGAVILTWNLIGGGDTGYAESALVAGALVMLVGFLIRRLRMGSPPSRRIDYPTTMIVIGFVWMAFGAVAWTWNLIGGGDTGGGRSSMEVGALCVAGGFVIRRLRMGSSPR